MDCVIQLNKVQYFINTNKRSVMKHIAKMYLICKETRQHVAFLLLHRYIQNDTGQYKNIFISKISYILQYTVEMTTFVIINRWQAPELFPN